MKRVSVLSILLMFAAAVGCDKNDASLEQSGIGHQAAISLSDMELPPAGVDNLKVSVTVSEPWELEFKDGNWLKTNTSGGNAGTTEIHFTASAGNAGEYMNNERKVKINIVSKRTREILQSVTFTQKRPYIKITPQGDVDLDWFRFGSESQAAKVTVESNIDWKFVKSGANDLHFDVTPGEDVRDNPNDRYYRRSTLSILPKDYTTEQAQFDLLFQPESDSLNDKVDINLRDGISFTHKHIVFLVDGKTNADYAGSEPRDFGQMTYNFRDSDPDGPDKPVWVFPITLDTDKGVKLTGIDTPSWLTQTSEDGNYVLKVSKVFFDEQSDVAPRRDTVVFKAEGHDTQGVKHSLEIKVPVSQKAFLFELECPKFDYEGGERSIHFNNHGAGVVPVEVNCSTHASWNIDYKSDWLQVKHEGKNAYMTVIPLEYNLAFESKECTVTVKSDVDPEVHRVFNVKQDEFKFVFEDADRDNPVGNMESSDTQTHSLTLDIDGPWTAEILKDGSNEKCDWMSFDGPASGEEGKNTLTVRANDTNNDEDNDRKARIVVTSTLHEKSPGGQKAVPALQNAFYFSVVIIGPDRTVYDENNNTVPVPAYMKEPGIYTIQVEASKGAVLDGDPEIPGLTILEKVSGGSALYGIKTLGEPEQLYNQKYRMINYSGEDVKSEDITVKVKYHNNFDSNPETREKERSFKISQDRYISALQDPSSPEVEPYYVAENLAINFTMSKDAPWKCEVSPEGRGWVNLSPSSGEATGEGQQVKVTVVKNAGEASRHCTVTFTDEFSGKQTTMDLTQKGYEFSVELKDESGNTVETMEFDELGGIKTGKGQRYTARVISSGPFTVRSNSGNGWIQPSPASQYPGTADVTLGAGINPTAAERPDIVTIRPKILDEVATSQNSVKEKTIVASQDAYHWSVELYDADGQEVAGPFNLSAVTSRSEGYEPYTLKVTSSGPWTMTGLPSWIEAPSTGGSGAIGGKEDQVELKVLNNRSKATREPATVKVLNSDVDVFAQNFQFSQEPFVLETADGTLKDRKFSVAAMNPERQWVKVNSTTANLTATFEEPSLILEGDSNLISVEESGTYIRFTPIENVMKAPRTGKITLKNADCDFEVLLDYEQDAYKFEASQTEITLDADGSPKTVAIICSGSWRCSWDQEWLSATPASGELTVRATKNEGEIREGRIKLESSDNPENNFTITVKQSKADQQQ